MNWGTCSRIGRRQAALSAAASVLVRALPAKAEPKPAWTALPPTPGRPAGAIQHVLRLRDTTLAVWELGAGPPVVMLHGGMANADWWAHQAVALARTHRVLNIDTRGHGRSPLPPGRLGYGIFAADTVAVMDALSIPRAHIVGWSDGAIAGLRLAIDHPERIASLFSFGGNFDATGTIAAGAAAPIFAAFASRCRAEHKRMNPRPADWDRLHDRLRQLWREEPRFARADLARVACPTTVYAAAHDEIIRLDHAKMLAASVAKGTFDLLDGASHFAMLQVPDAMARAIERHLVLVGDAKIVP